MQRRPLRAILFCQILAVLAVVFLGYTTVPVTVFADGSGGDPPPPNQVPPDSGDSTGGNSSIPVFPGGDEPTMSAEGEITLWDALLSAITTVI